jgi:hypothetical protein
VRTFCQKNGVKLVGGGSVRQSSKDVLCERTLANIDDPEGAQKDGESPSSKKKVAESGKVNRFRLLNVLFGDSIRPRLHERARNLHKNEMTLGRKTGQSFYEVVVDEYHSLDIDDYDEQQFPGIVKLSATNKPSVWTPINWQKAKEMTNTIFLEYEKACVRWKQSGNHHGEFNEKSFSDFANNVVRNNGTIID